MGDLSCDSESVPMEGQDTSFVCEDDPVLLQEALPLAGQTLCSCGELHQSKDGTHDHCMNGDSVESEEDIAASPSLGINTGKEGDGNSQSHVVSEYNEPKESSSYERSPFFVSSVRLVSAMKGGRERSGEASPTEVRRVKWAPDVYDPPVTSVDHSVKSHQQHPRSRKKEKNKQKHKKKRKSRCKNSGLHDAACIPPALLDCVSGGINTVLTYWWFHPLRIVLSDTLTTNSGLFLRLSSLDDFGDLEPEVVDCDAGGSDQEPELGCGFVHEMLDEATSSWQSRYSLKTSFPAAKAS